MSVYISRKVKKSDQSMKFILVEVHVGYISNQPNLQGLVHENRRFKVRKIEKDFINISR